MRRLIPLKHLHIKFGGKANSCLAELSIKAGNCDKIYLP